MGAPVKKETGFARCSYQSEAFTKEKGAPYQNSYSTTDILQPGAEADKRPEQILCMRTQQGPWLCTNGQARQCIYGSFAQMPCFIMKERRCKHMSMHSSVGA